MKFFDREEEIKEITSILESEPNFIYFMYGPINSGKTALIKEIITNLNKNKYVVFYFDLREIFISKYDNIIEVLFEEYSENKKPLDVIKSIIKDIPFSMISGIPIPKNTLEELLSKKTSKNVFRYISNIIKALKESGKQPIIIIDELQKIGDMKINGYFIYELFNYFISLTKHNHLCHVFCLSSDSLFIEKVYNEAMLNDRARYIFVADFNKEKAFGFMDLLSKEILDKTLSNNEKELIYNYVGGKPVDIIYTIDSLRTKKLKEILDDLLNDKIQKLKYFLKDLDYIEPKVNMGSEVIKIKKEDILNILKLFKNNYEISDDLLDRPTYTYLVKKNILFLDPIKGSLKPQSFLVWNALKKLFENE